MIVTILIFLIILGLLVFVHEAGHFIVAKKSGMKVEEFGFGFPPRAFGIQKVNGHWKIVWGHRAPSNSEDTVYSINWIPLGGFVKIFGENNDNPDDPRSFINRPFFRRLLTLLAGVLMNVVLAWVLVSAGYMIGLPAVVDNQTPLPHHGTLISPQVVIADVVPGSPAEKAGLQPSDVILSIDNNSFATITEAQTYILSHKGQQFTFLIKRIDRNMRVQVQSLSQPPQGSGPTGIGLAVLGRLRLVWYDAIIQGAQTTVSELGAIVTGIYHVFASGQGLKSLGGPIKIAQLTGQVADLGFAYLIQFTAFLSLNLAILNVLPFPALDGGRVLFLVIEKIRGKRNNQTVEQVANTAGFVLLLLLMAFITVRDVNSVGGLGHIFHKLIGG